MDDQRRMLMELMGTMGAETSDAGKGKGYTDPEICRLFLTGCCPGDLFKNTKLDRGGCGLIHSADCKRRYEKAREKKDYGFERVALEVLEQAVRDCDRKVMKAMPRNSTVHDANIGPVPVDNTEEIMQLQASIKLKTEEHDEAAKAGNTRLVDTIREQIEQLKVKISELKEGSKKLWDLSKPLQMTVCQICGGVLHQEEMQSDSRHYQGKIHVGFAKMREHIPILKSKILEGRTKLVKEKRRRSLSLSRSRSRSRHRHRRTRDDSESSYVSRTPEKKKKKKKKKEKKHRKHKSDDSDRD